MNNPITQRAKNMKVVILAGGKGTRFVDYPEKVPKPLALIGNRPILWHIMRTYAHYGFKDFIICLGYKGDLIKKYFIDYQTWKNKDVSINTGSNTMTLCESNTEENWNITLVDTGVDTPTGGRVKKAAKYIDGADFFLTYGDGVSDLNITELLAFHHGHGKVGTLTAVNPESQFGIVELDDNSLVKEFKEKPKLNKWINGGFFVFKKEFLNILTEDDILEKKPLEMLTVQKQLVAYKHQGFWRCMDTFKDYQVLNDLWKENNAPWKV